MANEEQKEFLDTEGLAHLWAELKKKFSKADHTHPEQDMLHGINVTGDGTNYTGTVENLTALKRGMTITIIPDTTSATTIPKLNLNGLGAKSIKQKLSVNTSLTVAAVNTTWMVANKPVALQFDGTQWVTLAPRSSADDIYGTVAVTSGGTGVKSVTAGNFLVGNGESKLTEKTPAEVLSIIGARPDTWTPTAEEVGAATPAEVTAAVKKAAPVNLLDNSDFTNLVAQAGFIKTHGGHVSYFADRWQLAGHQLSYDESSRTITFPGGGLSQLIQAIAKDLSGKPVTLAIKAGNVSGNVYLTESGAESGHADVQIQNGITVHRFTGGANAIIWSGEQSGLIIDWVALYEGDYTAETLPEYHPKGYAHELMECQRYYLGERTIIARNAGSTYAIANYNYPVTMRVNPTITFIGPVRNFLSGADTGMTVTTHNVNSANSLYVVQFNSILADIPNFSLKFTASADL